MPYDSAATKKRLLDAALDEFAERGLAGARVDRIAEKACANKQAIYAYFGSKEDLFRCVLQERCESALEAVPLDASDLPAFVAGVFDHLVENPKSVRMMLWRQLELPDEAEHDAVAAKVQALAAAHELGVPPRQCAEDLFTILLGLSMAWFTCAPGQQAAKGAAAQQRLHAFRRSLIASTEAIVKTMTKKKR
ncbi:TetR/AcrR family transcriptional regulator [Sorangium sp. So ce1182]|uniref:TetR/AcrR family transcriptional regulator n=1 Tax=Sorangium sp. So ce1182 TaxID=3133334 RepID=UPI003F6441F0